MKGLTWPQCPSSCVDVSNAGPACHHSPNTSHCPHLLDNWLHHWDPPKRRNIKTLRLLATLVTSLSVSTAKIYKSISPLFQQICKVNSASSHTSHVFLQYRFAFLYCQPGAHETYFCVCFPSMPTWCTQNLFQDPKTKVLQHNVLYKVF